MKMVQYQVVKSTEDINEKIKKGTKGVILEVLSESVFLVEFVNEKNETLDDGMTTVTADKLELCK
jgi:hypothetical protein